MKLLFRSVWVAVMACTLVWFLLTHPRSTDGCFSLGNMTLGGECKPALPTIQPTNESPRGIPMAISRFIEIANPWVIWVALSATSVIIFFKITFDEIAYLNALSQEEEDLSSSSMTSDYIHSPSQRSEPVIFRSSE